MSQVRRQRAFARACPTATGKGEGRRNGGKSGKTGGWKGKGLPNGKRDDRVCSECGKARHIEATCSKSHPELKKGRPVKAAEEQQKQWCRDKWEEAKQANKEMMTDPAWIKMREGFKKL